MSLIVDGKVDNIYYCSEVHRNKDLLALSYEDKGEVRIDDNGISFIGSKIQLKFENLKKIELVPNESRMLGGFIRIYYSDTGVDKIANLIKLDDLVLMGKQKENTSDLFKELMVYAIDWIRT
jgi:hypothetical protein